MNTIPTLYKRDPDDPRYVTAEISDDCEWVLTDPDVIVTNGHTETLDRDELQRLGLVAIGPPLVADPEALIATCREFGYEGIVWHHPDGRRAELKVSDYPAVDA